MWVVATQEKFEEYGIKITTQRQLSDGEYIMHMELTEYPEFILNSRLDDEVKWLTDEEILELIENEE